MINAQESRFKFCVIKMKVRIWLVLGIFGVRILFMACEHSTVDYSDLAAPRARWQAYGLKNYSIEQKRICFCPPPHGFVRLTIKDDKIVGGVDLTTGQVLSKEQWQYFQTIDELFAWIATARAMNPARLEVEYDAVYGYPRKIEFDYGENIADDELWIEMQALKKINE